MLGAGIGQRNDTNAVPYCVRGDGRSRLSLQEGDHIWRRHDRLPVALGDEEFILERNAQSMAAMLVQPLDVGLAAREAADRPAKDVLDPTVEDDLGAERGAD